MIEYAIVNRAPAASMATGDEKGRNPVLHKFIGDVRAGRNPAFPKALESMAAAVRASLRCWAERVNSPAGRAEQAMRNAKSGKSTPVRPLQELQNELALAAATIACEDDSQKPIAELSGLEFEWFLKTGTRLNS